MSDTENLRRVLEQLESQRAAVLGTLGPDRPDDAELERLGRIQLAIQAIRDVLEGERKDQAFEEWLQRADYE